MVFLTILLGLMPSFLLVALGGGLRNRLTQAAWQGLDKLNFEVLFPALIFVAAASRPIGFGDIVTIGPLVWSVMTLGLALGYLARRFGPTRFLDFAGCWQVAWRFNTALAFVAVETLSQPPLGALAVAVGLAIPLANVFAVTALSRDAESLWQTVGRVARNPFLLAALAGVVVGISGVSLPALLLAPLELLARAAIPLALVSVGATMNWGALARLDRFSGIIVGTKLLALPVFALGLTYALSLSPTVAATLVLFAAMPTASAAHVLAAGFGADRQWPATLVAQTTLLSAVTLPLWITVIELAILR